MSSISRAVLVDQTSQQNRFTTQLVTRSLDTRTLAAEQTSILLCLLGGVNHLRQRVVLLVSVREDCHELSIPDYYTNLVWRPR